MKHQYNYKPTFHLTTIILTSLMLSIVSPAVLPDLALRAYGAAGEKTWVVEERNVLITAYYSPLPNQRRYYLGSYEADIAFNGHGIQGYDGTPVYAGMIAAPPAYPFGTRVEMTDLDVVGTVHDRGGRIEEGEDGTLRLDLWMGKGEEGLARALNFGAKTMSAKLYIPKEASIPEERFNLALFPAPETTLKKLPSNPISLIGEQSPRRGDTSSVIAAIQYALDQLGYFDHAITSYYGDVTQIALQRFQRDANIKGSAEIADKETREKLAVHIELREELGDPVPTEEMLINGTDGKAVRVLQRILELLALYTGETDGVYDQELMSTVYKFQKSNGLVSSPTDTGAGMVGPQTRRSLLAAWREHRITQRGGVEKMVAALNSRLE